VVTPEARTEPHLGEQFVRAVAGRDAAGLTALLSDDIDFKALTPNRFWEADSAEGVVRDVIFGHWFEKTARIDAIEAVECTTVAERQRVGYRLRVTNDDGMFAVEQQAYLDVRDGRITWLRIMCAGYQPIA
jgi:ketosteroid isomerase-like protein